MTIESIDKCIYWQEYVMRATKDPKQAARCQAAIERLKQQRAQIAAVAA